MHKYHLTIFLLMLFCLTGCVPVYQAPAQKPVAIISIRNDNHLPENQMVVFQDPYACTGQTFLGNINQRLSGHIENINIAANQFTTILVLHRVYNKLLFLTLSFVPQSNYSYIIQIKNAPINANQSQATLQLLGANMKNQTNIQYHPISFIKRTLPKTILSTPSCTDYALQNQLRLGHDESLPKTTTLTQIYNDPVAVVVVPS